MAVARDTVAVLDDDGVGLHVVVEEVALVVLGMVRRFFFSLAGSTFSLLSPTKMLIVALPLANDEAAVPSRSVSLVTAVLGLMILVLMAEAAEAVGSMVSLMHS